MRLVTALVLVLAACDDGLPGKQGGDTDVDVDTRDTEPGDTEVAADTDTDVAVETDTEIPVDTDTDVPIDTDTDVPVDTDTDVPVDTDTDLPPVDTDTDLPPVDTDTDLPPIDTDTNVPPIDTDTDTDVRIDTDTDLPPVDTDTDLPPVDTDTDLPPIDTDTNVPPIDTDTDTDTDTDVPVDTDTDVPPVDTDTDVPPVDTDTNVPPVDTDTDTEVPVDTDTDVALAGPFDHVIVEVTVGGAGQGFDLDGDGSIDNALGLFGAALGPSLADAIAQAADVVVLQLAGIDDLATATSGDFAFFPAEDLDTDASDNGSGVEPVRPFAGAVDVDGVAVVSIPVALVSGAYTTTWPVQAITVGSDTWQTATPIHVSGTVTVASHDGLIGFGLETSTIAAVITDAGYPTVAALVGLFADLDTDGDGTNDALSMTLVFHAPSCTLVP